MGHEPQLVMWRAAPVSEMASARCQQGADLGWRWERARAAVGHEPQLVMSWAAPVSEMAGARRLSVVRLGGRCGLGCLHIRPSASPEGLCRLDRRLDPEGAKTQQKLVNPPRAVSTSAILG